jgi:hypothetical protein
MCDQDHFEDDRQQFESLGLVTRKQFGMMLGAGVAMMLPQVANAAAVTESDVSVTTSGPCTWYSILHRYPISLVDDHYVEWTFLGHQP